jgi:hypothetical protein
MLGADLVREIVASQERGEGAKRIAREFGVNCKGIKHWLRLGSWQLQKPAYFTLVKQRVRSEPAAWSIDYREFE